MVGPRRLYVDPHPFLIDSFRLARQIYDDGFYPDFIVGLWRGGSVPGVSIQEFFDYMGIETDHISVRTSRYGRGGRRSKRVKIYGLGYVIDNIDKYDDLLIVDDVFDEGITAQALVREVRKRARANTPDDIRIATVYYKPERNLTSMMPDYYIHETKRWIIFPHELEGLSRRQLIRKDPEVAALIPIKGAVRDRKGVRKGA